MIPTGIPSAPTCATDEGTFQLILSPSPPPNFVLLTIFSLGVERGCETALMYYEDFKREFIDTGVILSDEALAQRLKLKWTVGDYFMSRQPPHLHHSELSAEWNSNEQLRRQYADLYEEEIQALKARWPNIDAKWQKDHLIDLTKMPDQLRMPLVYNVSMYFRNYLHHDGTQHFSNTAIYSRFEISWMDENYQGEIDIYETDGPIFKMNIVDMYQIQLE